MPENDSGTPGYDPAKGAALEKWVMETKAMNEKIEAALAEARSQRDEAGRSEKGRLLSILVTELEKVKAFWEYLDRQEP